MGFKSLFETYLFLEESEGQVLDKAAKLKSLTINNGYINTTGVNTIFQKGMPIVDFGIKKYGNMEINDVIFPNSVYLLGGFNASRQGRGYGTLGVNFLFHNNNLNVKRYWDIDNIVLHCYDTACPFWLKLGGKQVDSRDITGSGKELRTVVISKQDFLNSGYSLM